MHRAPPELAKTGLTPGIAVNLHMPAGEIRARVEARIGPIEEDDEQIGQSGRRRAARATARVPAHLETHDGECVAGLTRNLSSQGVLVSVDGETIPVGTLLKLSLDHPSSSENIEVDGRVVRHVESDAGEITAIGIRFDLPEARRAEVERFVGALKATEHSRRLGGISGAIAEIGVQGLLRMFGECAPQGTFTLTNGPDEGFVAFEDGLLHSARVGRSTGIPALAKILSWTEGDFEFHARIDRDGCQKPRLPLEDAIREALGSSADESMPPGK